MSGAATSLIAVLAARTAATFSVASPRLSKKAGKKGDTTPNAA
jgi:hypothetical protein